MALLAVTFPVLSPRDLEWIQQLRAEHNREKYDLIDPHLTLVFPAEGFAEDDFLGHVNAVCERFAAISFILRGAVIFKGAFDDRWYLFLVPEEGYTDLVRLHDELYTGLLADELRADIPYVPHLTIGESDNADVCRQVADEINTANIAVRGQMAAIDVLRLEDGKIHRISTTQLRNK